jgi:DNA-binding transcriptional ArsR family regulator
MNIDELSPATLTFAKAMADSTRQKIMQACCCQWCSVGDLVERVGVGQPTVSHHLGILRQAGLVHVREEGRQTFSTRIRWRRAAGG